MMTDDSANVAWRAKYLPYGEVYSITGSAALDYRFPGQWFQLESGLHYDWHRHYDPTTRRYMQPDQLGMPDGPSRWAYAFNSPLIGIDPYGLAWKIAGYDQPGSQGFDRNGVGGGGSGFGGAGLLTGLLWLFCPQIAEPPPLSDPLGNTLLNQTAGDGDASHPPPDAKPIDQTKWSGDHQQIKKGIGAGPKDNVRVRPNGDVWAQNPDGSWTNHGSAGDYTGSGGAKGRRGKDRDPW